MSHFLSSNILHLQNIELQAHINKWNVRQTWSNSENLPKSRIWCETKFDLGQGVSRLKWAIEFSDKNNPWTCQSKNRNQGPRNVTRYFGRTIVQCSNNSIEYLSGK